MGSFLLFFANFLSILLVASAVFFVSGMAREFESITKKDVLRRFGLATFGFLIVVALLPESGILLIIRNALESQGEHGNARVAKKSDIIWLKRKKNSLQDQADIERLENEEESYENASESTIMQNTINT